MSALTEQQLAAIGSLLDGAKPATDDLLLSIAEQIRDRREHDHESAGPDWDWYCLNASGWLGDKAPTVLRRLLDAEAEVERLREELTREQRLYAAYRKGAAETGRAMRAEITKARAAGLLDAAEIVGNDDDCECGGCDSCVPRALARLIRDRAYALARGER